MAKAINLILAAALAAAALASAISLAALTEAPAKTRVEVCVERICGVVFF